MSRDVGEMSMRLTCKKLQGCVCALRNTRARGRRGVGAFSAVASFCELGVVHPPPPPPFPTHADAQTLLSLRSVDGGGDNMVPVDSN